MKYQTRIFCTEADKALMWDEHWIDKIFPGTVRHPHKPDAVINDFSELAGFVKQFMVHYENWSEPFISTNDKGSISRQTHFILVISTFEQHPIHFTRVYEGEFAIVELSSPLDS